MRFTDDFLDEVRHRLPISELVGKYVTWDKKKTRVNRGDYWACCPFHGENKPSFHCEDSKGRYHCFGCGVSGNHFRFIMEKDGLSFPRAVEEVAMVAGMKLPDRGPMTPKEQAEAAHRAEERLKAKKAKERHLIIHREERIASAADIWRETLPLPGTLAEDYLVWRGLAQFDDENLRFHPNLERYPDKPNGDRHPALIGRVQDREGKGCAIWRIYLERDGKGKSSAFENPKIGFGPASGGAVRLGGFAATIGIGEGIETSRAVKELGAPYPVWAALSTSGLMGFDIPAGIRRVIVYPDPDRSKIKTGKDGKVRGSPGLTAFRKFKEHNADWPGVIDVADSAWDADYLEVLQKAKGLPIR